MDNLNSQETYISIIIPAYNEEDRIEYTLRSISAYLSRQSYLYEVIVVNDGSRDKTVEVVLRLISEFPSEFLVRLEWKGSFPVRVQKNRKESPVTRPMDTEEIAASIGTHRTARRKIKALLILWVRRLITSHSRVRLSELLCCPHCRGVLAEKEEGFLCGRCSLFYPEKNGIYFFLEGTTTPETAR